MNDITLCNGDIYLIRHSGKIIKAKFLSTQRIESKYFNTRTRYHFLNLETEREIILKSKQKVIKLFQLAQSSHVPD